MYLEIVLVGETLPPFATPPPQLSEPNIKETEEWKKIISWDKNFSFLYKKSSC